MSESEPTLFSAVASLAGAIGHADFPAGDLAELRRLRPQNPPPAFWRLLVDRTPEALRVTEADERRWAVLMQGMAIMAPHVHAPRFTLGRALAAIGSQSTAEARLLRFLRSQGEQLEDQIRIVARRLAAAESPVDWTGIARLLFATIPEEHDRACRSLARDFYASQHDEN